MIDVPDRSARQAALDFAALGHADQRARPPRPAVREQQRDLGDRRDAGKRLAAEAERRDTIEVVGGADLAGRMAQEGDAHLVRGDAAAVVLHADQTAAALAHLDPNVGRAGVQAVLDQLLDGRRGTLDHLAGGDLVGDFGREDSNRHDADCTTRGHSAAVPGV